MKKRLFLFATVVIITVLACNAPSATTTVPGASDTPVPEVEGAGPSPMPPTDIPTSTSTPELPPPPTLPPVAGLTVAYIKEGNVWLWTEGGSPVQLTSSGFDYYPQLSSDSQVVSFWRDSGAGSEVWAVNADGSYERVLVSRSMLDAMIVDAGTAIDVRETAWGVNEHKIYFNTFARQVESGFGSTQYDLYTVDADFPGAGPSFFESVGSGGIPYVSPDGQMLAMVQGDEIITVGVTGAIAWRVALTFDPVMTYSEWTFHPEPVWLPDSSGFRVVIPASDSLGNPSEPTELWDVPNTGTPSMLGSFVALPAFSSRPSLSPNGNSVAYLANNDGSWGLHTFTVGIGDHFYTLYDPNQVSLGGWSTDSNYFIYWRGPADNPLYVLGVLGGDGLPFGDIVPVDAVTFVDATRSLYLSNYDLRLWTVGGTSIFIDSSVTQYDFNN